ncbi:nuclear transport factor 2 family protein [Sandarakinorhabdus oryzae]|uniref:nuclear transport factor 2 family protein n=1 Tax=Sandarakinorhabdus oryzae TaxID=2675220 RepID=UPI0012E219BA|nr:nuclear transport factor 2 family protein [Sandarakinorhabdus oryzae]
MSPRDVVLAWVAAFNRADLDALAALYAPDAVNHQMAYGPLQGRAAIRAMFDMEFGRAKMVCQVVQVLEDGDWAVLEWTDPTGLRGCGFFRVAAGQIVHQRGYFDRLQFYEAQGIDLAQAAAAEAAMKKQ